jgi:cell division septation protein DedD
MSMRPDIADGGAVRNLDQIQEQDPSARPSRLGALVLASLGGACIVFAAVALVRTPPKARPTSADPLGDLVARAHPAGVKVERRGDLAGSDITFPTVLSDTKNTTALEAVRAPQTAASAVAADLLARAPLGPPPAADRLPVVPLPAQNILQPPPEDSTSRDALTAMAHHVSREGSDEGSPAGIAGGYQLQVSSFKTQPDAEAFAQALRRRGHKAYVEPAYVKGRGLWHRVRVGPFKYRRSAVIYRQDFEAKERIVTFIVEPPKTTVKVAESPAQGNEAPQ